MVYGKAAVGSAVELSEIEKDTDLGGFVINGSSPGDALGRNVSNAGDINRDGFDDLIVSSNTDTSGQSAGSVYVIYGKAADGLAVSVADIKKDTDLGGFIINGTATGNYVDSISNAGDINGDGYDDLIIGSGYVDTNGAEINGENTGATYIIYGKATNGTAIELSDIKKDTDLGGFILNGAATGDHFGSRVSDAGDVNGDGYDDVIVGSDPTIGEDHGIYVIFGKEKDGLAVNVSDIVSGTGGFKINSDASYGIVLNGDFSGAGDVNGDGFDDVILTRYHDKTTYGPTGTSYVVYGKAGSSSIDIIIKNGSSVTGYDVISGAAGFAVNSTYSAKEADWYGHSVSGAGDTNGDGFDDLLISVPRSDLSFVVYGGNYTGAVTQVGTTSADVIAGTDSNDVIFAGNGADNISGSAGVDQLSGGEGADTFSFSAEDGIARITDFNGHKPQGEGDKINISAFNFEDFTAVQAALTASQGGSYDTKLALDTDTFVYFHDMLADDFIADDFII